MPAEARTVWQRLAALPDGARVAVRETAWLAILQWRQDARRTFLSWGPADVEAADALLLAAVAAAEALLPGG
jgi:hypothetical protein